EPNDDERSRGAPRCAVRCHKRALMGKVLSFERRNVRRAGRENPSPAGPGTVATAGRTSERRVESHEEVVLGAQVREYSRLQEVGGFAISLPPRGVRLQRLAH